ncbi:MAG: DUF222 domain-containing protein [Acidobacteria bacterium]|nr:DUF222 domain-containing protein [Acidobacteriota bacterium]
MLALTRQLSQLEAVTARALARWDANRSWADDGGRSGAAWLAAKTHLPKPTCRRRIRLGRTMRDLPAVAAAWLAGDVDGAHVGALGANRNDTTAAPMTRDEDDLVRMARNLSYQQFCRALAYWRHRADPDGTERDAARMHEQRRLDCAQSWRGAWFGSFTLGPIAGAVVDEALRRIEDELFEADWAEAKHLLGRDPAITELSRTAAQRRADALVEMAIRAHATPPGGRRPKPLLSVVVGLETLKGRICELANGTPIAPGSLIPWLDDAEIERIVFDGESRVIDVGVRQRLFTGATRRAVEIRDRECFHDLCDVPVHRCQIDHVVPYGKAGQTTQHNGRVACGFHNRLRNTEDPQGP